MYIDEHLSACEFKPPVAAVEHCEADGDAPLSPLEFLHCTPMLSMDSPLLKTFFPSVGRFHQSTSGMVLESLKSETSLSFFGGLASQGCPQSLALHRWRRSSLTSDVIAIGEEQVVSRALHLSPTWFFMHWAPAS